MGFLNIVFIQNLLFSLPFKWPFGHNSWVLFYISQINLLLRQFTHFKFGIYAYSTHTYTLTLAFHFVKAPFSQVCLWTGWQTLSRTLFGVSLFDASDVGKLFESKVVAAVAEKRINFWPALEKRRQRQKLRAHYCSCCCCCCLYYAQKPRSILGTHTLKGLSA